ncbi:protein of unknown function [Taphrina deformans PYCC 5710]|uniref:Uncharacterized protein n=1 Tax=Taphrina deformans (strain PYCC 5710 / ATCC 11124 / CBS 356.35 / IMI 108563 / JCM 9778 / NBRC 8474) TaxID=1097556 RepID=R4XLJ0_TAPDE|nr:protein of unknown function [Taphrina deformans PYCC 5710]|eukprot:CCG84155.1 protein of unknown function [Taphrina deformans PYCC 5710]
MMHFSLLSVPLLPLRQISLLRQATTDAKKSSEDTSDNSKIGDDWTAILKTMDQGRKQNTRYQNNPLPDLMPKAAFLSNIRRPVAASGPFSTYAGRTKEVKNGDISAAFRALNSTLRNNSVARDYRTQKFYEKPSNKRVRLNRERHRKRFLSGVKRLVNLVKEQRKFL